jgi:hypothetical protein
MEARGNVNESLDKSEQGKTAFWWALKKQKKIWTSALLTYKHPVEKERCTNNGQTPLLMVLDTWLGYLLGHNLDNILLLLDCGVNVTAKDSRGQNALHFLVWSREPLSSSRAMKVLEAMPWHLALEHDVSGLTPLQTAARSRNGEFLKYFWNQWSHQESVERIFCDGSLLHDTCGPYWFDTCQQGAMVDVLLRIGANTLYIQEPAGLAMLSPAASLTSVFNLVRAAESRGLFDQSEQHEKKKNWP